MASAIGCLFRTFARTWSAKGHAVMPRVLRQKPRKTGSQASFLSAGIASFFGLDEHSILERKYEQEVEAYNAKDDEEGAEERIKDILKLAVLDIQKDELEKASKMLHVALRMATDLQHEQAKTYIYSMMADLAMKRGDYGQAERLFVNVMQRRIGIDGEKQDSNSILEMSLKLAEIYGIRGEDETAAEGYRFCIDSAHKRIESGDRDEDTLAIYGMSCDWFGQFLVKRGRVTEAVKHFETAYENSKRLNGVDSDQTLILLNGLATANSMSGNAEAANRQFIMVVTGARRWNSPHLAAFLANYGLHLVNNLAIGDAEANCKEALAFGKMSKDPEVLANAKSCLQKVKDAKKNQ